VGVNKKRTTTFLLSDLIDSPGDMSKLEDALKIASSKHDIMAIEVFDKCDSELPDVGIIEVRDAETGATEWLDTSSRKVRDFWREQYTERREKMQSLLRHNRIDFASVATNGDYVAELIKMFKQR
jgi:uncharacterized protein (DUF58 family)